MITLSSNYQDHFIFVLVVIYFFRACRNWATHIYTANMAHINQFMQALHQYDKLIQKMQPMITSDFLVWIHIKFHIINRSFNVISCNNKHNLVVWDPSFQIQSRIKIHTPFRHMRVSIEWVFNRNPTTIIHNYIIKYTRL